MKKGKIESEIGNLNGKKIERMEKVMESERATRKKFESELNIGK